MNRNTIGYGFACSISRSRKGRKGNGRVYPCRMLVAGDAPGGELAAGATRPVVADSLLGKEGRDRHRRRAWEREDRTGTRPSPSQTEREREYRTGPHVAHGPRHADGLLADRAGRLPCRDALFVHERSLFFYSLTVSSIKAIMCYL
jgi:hypothetical protein